MRTRQRWLHLPHDHGEPIWRCRYDVVAGVLFAVAGVLLWATYKNPTHAVTIDLPGPTHFDLPQWCATNEAVVNLLAPQTDGTIEWNGELVSETELREQVFESLTRPVEPLLVFRPEPNASYELSLKAMAIVRQSGVTKFCFAGLEDHRHFDTGGLPGLFAIQASAVSLVPRSTIVPLDIEPIEPLSNPPACSVPDKQVR